MIEVWDEHYLNNLIINQIEENLHLEYKGSESLGKSEGKKKEISKDVSAFANSDGGIIIYGMKEFDEVSSRHLPEKIDPINRNDFTKEWLEQIINTNIYPRISKFLITPVTIEDSERIVYVVEIPKSNTAHQANDKRYYKRFNFESVPMFDYEIKDILNRSHVPNIEIEFKILFEEYRPRSTALVKATRKKLNVYAFNNGGVYASYINCFLDLPYGFIANFGSETSQENFFDIDGIKYERIYCDNTTKDVIDIKGSGYLSTEVYGPSRYEPILPKTRRKLKTIPLISVEKFLDSKIYWSVYADNAEQIDGSILISEIMIEEFPLKK